MRPASRTAAGVLLLAAMVLGPPMATAHDVNEDHVSLHMEHQGAEALLRFHLKTDLLVEEDDGGVYLRSTLPDPFDALGTFRPLDPVHEGTTNVVHDGDGTPMAEFRWTTDAPAAGTRIENVTLEATANVDPTDDLAVTWDGLHQDPLAAVVSLPDTHTLTGSSELVKRFHGTPDGRVEWTDIDLAGPTLSFTIRSAAVGDDPARNVPPFPYSQVLIVIGAGTLTGLLWYWGFREDEDRRKRL